MATNLLPILRSQERNQAWLARKTGRSEAVVSRIVNGKRRPSADFRRRAAVALSLPEAVIFPPTGTHIRMGVDNVTVPQEECCVAIA